MTDDGLPWATKESLAISGVRSRYVCITWSRRTELNTFIVSCLTMILGLSETILLVMNSRTAWTAASVPPLTETSSWIGDSLYDTAQETA